MTTRACSAIKMQRLKTLFELQGTHICYNITYFSELLCVYKTSPSATLQHQALDVGSNLFYHIASLVSDDTKYYTPAEQFLSSCIETLGQVIIESITC